MFGLLCIVLYLFYKFYNFYYFFCLYPEAYALDCHGPRGYHHASPRQDTSGPPKLFHNIASSR